MENNIQVYYEAGKYVVKKDDITLLIVNDGNVSLINEDVVVTTSDAINIYQNIRNGLLSASIISKQGIVLAKPMLYGNLIIVVFKNGIVQFDTSLNVVKELSWEIDGVIHDERIVDNYFVFVISTDNDDEEIIYNIKNNSIERKKVNYNIALLRN